MAPFLGGSIGSINFQFVAIKKLVRAYVEEVGVVLSPLHVHSLKYLPKGPRNRRMRKNCDVCRDNLARCKPAWECYNCSDCNYNLCIRCCNDVSCIERQRHRGRARMGPDDGSSLAGQRDWQCGGGDCG